MSDVLHLLLWLAVAVATLVVGIALGVATMRSIRRSKRGAAFMVAATLFTSFAFLGGRQADWVEESKDETKRKKENPSGDPPVPDGGPSD